MARVNGGAENDAQRRYRYAKLLGFLLARLHIVWGGRLITVDGVCRRLSGSVTLHGRPAGGFTRAGQA